jgi:outer membrane protein
MNVLKRKHLPLLVLVIGIGASSPALAQTAEWRLGGRALYVASGTTSEELGDTGYRLDLSSGLGLEFMADLMFSERFGAEFSIAAAAPRLELVGDACCDVDGDRLWLIPLTAVAQYHVNVYGKWDPYIGLGVTWIVPIYSLSNDFSDAGIDELDLEGDFGLVAQLGVNYTLDSRWYVNLDLRYLGASVDARVSTNGEDLPPVTLDIKPFVAGLGFGYRY